MWCTNECYVYGILVIITLVCLETVCMYRINKSSTYEVPTEKPLYRAAVATACCWCISGDIE